MKWMDLVMPAARVAGEGYYASNAHINSLKALSSSYHDESTLKVYSTEKWGAIRLNGLARALSTLQRGA